MQKIYAAEGRGIDSHPKNWATLPCFGLGFVLFVEGRIEINVSEKINIRFVQKKKKIKYIRKGSIFFLKK